MFYDEYHSDALPTLLLLHGAGLVDTFARQYDALDGYHLIVPHIYGNGREVGEQYEPQRAADDIASLVRSLGCGKLAVAGHSMGGELAVKLVSEHPELFSRAVFLSAWVCSSERAVREYERVARATAGMLKWRWLLNWQASYWRLDDGQRARFLDYAPKITAQQYADFFAKRVKLDELKGYRDVKLPMLALCGSRETREMKRSLAALGSNPNCRTEIIKGADHDYPMRLPEELNPRLTAFLKEDRQN